MQRKIIFLLLCISHKSYAQPNGNIDSLLQRISVQQQDTTKLNLLLLTAEYYLDNDNNSSLCYNRQAEQLLDFLQAEQYRHGCYHDFVKIYHAKFDYENSLACCGMLSGIKYPLNTIRGNLIMTSDNAQAFERSIDMLDSSIQEMRRVAHNMMPEALVKFRLDTALKDFCNDINQTGALKITYQSIGLKNEQSNKRLQLLFIALFRSL